MNPLQLILLSTAALVSGATLILGYYDKKKKNRPPIKEGKIDIEDSTEGTRAGTTE